MKSEYIELAFHLDHRSGVAPYLQLVQQVKNALKLGILQVGDQLPTVRTVVASLAINPNTVLKAYRELEREGLIGSRPGQGTFVLQTLAGPDTSHQAMLRAQLEEWIRTALELGFDQEGLHALFETALYHVVNEEPQVRTPHDALVTKEEHTFGRKE